MLSDIIILLVLVLLNGFFSLSEMALVSSRRQRLEALKSERLRMGGSVIPVETAIELHQEPGRFLSAVQIGITLVGVFTGAFGATTLSAPLAAWLAPLPLIGAYAGAIAFAFVVVIITYLSLILGELAPKRIALSNPEKIAAAVAGPMNNTAHVLKPFVTFLSWSTEAVVRLYGITGQNVPQVTEDEIKHLIEEGAATGAIEGVERDIVNRVFRLSDMRVSEIMTPRIQMVWLDTEAPLAENLATIRRHQNMRYPIRKGVGGAPVGMARLEDLFHENEPRTNQELFAKMSPPLYIPRTASVLKALSILQSEVMYMAFIIDEYGDVVGTLSMAEIFFAMVGDISDHAGDPHPSIFRRDDGSYLIDGVVSVDEVRRLLKLAKLPGDESAEVNTLAGVIFNWFGRMPNEGDHFGWNGYRFEVVDMDGPRIDKIMIVPAQNLPIGKASTRAAD
ncbi:MAG: hemolysin family protein [Parvibaculum sp.]